MSSVLSAILRRAKRRPALGLPFLMPISSRVSYSQRPRGQTLAPLVEPNALELCHDRSNNHRREVLASVECACFCCLGHFATDAIVEWIDSDQTALCPLCGVDSVLGDASGMDLCAEFLAEMRRYWFGEAKQPPLRSGPGENE